jgi:hypothetical protein
MNTLRTLIVYAVGLQLIFSGCKKEDGKGEGSEGHGEYACGNPTGRSRYIYN